VKTVERTFELLEALHDLDGAGISELSTHTGMVNSTIHRHLTTLVDLGYVSQEDDDTYYVSLGFIALGEYARTRRRGYRLAIEKVDTLAEETNERCQFVVPEQGYGVYVHVVTGASTVETNSQIGTKVHLHSTAVGHAMLAHLPREEVTKIVERRGLPRMTDATICTPEALFERLEQVRDTQVASDHEENVRGLQSVGSAIVHEGSVLGGISVSGPTYRMRRNRFDEEIGQLVLGAVNEIELELQYS
jgi:DNA-binding IclR family transcriptional regulator